VSRDEAATVAGNLADVLRQPVLYGVRRIDIGASIGIGIYPDDGLERAELLRAADAAMYQAKASPSGKRFAFFSPGENTSPGRGRLRAAGAAGRVVR
jgi:GGDEF domain-containing protein